ncbi:MAG: enoyl-CoA hydratase/isomerase family protein [Dehalococcoidales bacterium]|nr:enoyl-CoA hydratase/isomerase family protein [Dehalococcoidales bacterium]
MKEIKKFVVLGAGAMGAQIGALAAESGFDVTIRDLDEKYIERGRQIIEGNYDKRIKRGRFTEEGKKQVLGRMKFVTDLQEAMKDADYVIEAVPEILELKQKVFGEASALSPADCVFATNTSSLSISEIAKGARYPEKVVGTHYFNPPGTLILLEIIQGEKTDADTLAIADIVGKKMGREIVHVKDVPGFLVNRIWLMVANEGEWAVVQGEAKSKEQVDSAARYKMGLPMGVMELDDILQGGAIDTRYHVMEHFRETLGESYGPSPLTVEAFKAGHYGKRSGKGFYDWSEGQTNEIQMNAGADFDIIRILSNGVNECCKLLESNSTTKEEIDRGVIQGLNYPRGILRMADSVGLDNILAELNRLEARYKEERYKAAPMLVKMVAEGKLGRKSGQGFFSYGVGEYEFLIVNVDRETRVAKIILNRTYRANALNLDLIKEIDAALDWLESRNDVGCVVITGAGANFSGGADVSSFAAGRMDSVLVFTEAGQDLSTRLETYSKPVIAAINGPAMGGGFEMALACDIRIMSKKAQLRLPELGLGLTPGLGGTQRLIRLIGAARAKEIVLLADPVMADKALEWGIVNFIAEPDQFEAKVDEIASKLAKGAPLAQKMAKKAFYYGVQADQRTGLFIEATVSGDLMFTKDLNEGLTSMNYRRAPKFIGQ